ncbi:MAG TPA: hypothetical protein VFU23_09855, partial [Gemmatimonadales bacterium]|nr:hypothetical protein [Gemmatimonadales bacterium]
QEQQRTAQQELDETAERLKRLASRQQQENERMQRMADALRDRMGQQGSGGGGGGQQRQLAKEAEEEAHRLERLAREQNSPELAQAARSMQEAADAMRKAASDSPNSGSQGSAALDRLKGATRDLENARTAGQSETVRDLQRRAEELGNRQREVAQGVKELPGAAGADKAEKMRRLAERKDGIASDVERLQADAERVARDTRREQPGAAGKVDKAATAIRDSRIHDKVLYSKELMRSGSPEVSERMEAQITGNIEDVAGTLREAAGALTESEDARRERALEQARELVRGLESLKERIGAKQSGGQQPGGKGEGQQGQQGERNSGQGQRGQGQGQGQAEASGQGQGTGQGQQQGQPNATGGGGANGGGQIPGGAPANGRIAGGDARQFAREFRLRREAAESLSRALGGRNVDGADLERAIADLKRLESGRPFSDPKDLERLQQAVIEGLKNWEFRLWRVLGQTGGDRPAMGAPAAAPPEYRAMVEEYYRSLARKRPPDQRPPAP